MRPNKGIEEAAAADDQYTSGILTRCSSGWPRTTFPAVRPTAS